MKLFARPSAGAIIRAMRQPGQFALTAFLLLAGCADGIEIGAMDQRPAYDPSLVQYITRNGTLGVVVRGAPFGVSGDDPAPVLAAMSAPGWLGNVRLVPGQDSGRGYRIVLIFGPGAGEPCALPPTLPATSGEAGLHVQASFCAGRQVLSTLVGSSPPVHGADDPRFRQLLDQVIANLLPPYNRDRIRSEDGAGM